jgi:SdpC family antimicrobial peptide
MHVSPIRLTAAVLVTTFAVSVLGAQHKPGAATTKPATPRYTAEEVFAALMFRTGNATAIFPKIPRTTARPKTRAAASKYLQAAPGSLQKEGLIGADEGAKLAAIAKGVAEGKARPAAAPDPARLAQFVTDEIKRGDSAFFDRFKTEITSGDQRRVKALMSEASKLSSRVLLGQVDAQRPLDGPTSAALAQAIAINTNTFINVDSAINVNVAYNVDTVKNVTNVFNDEFLTEASRLRNEVIVNQITLALRGMQFR